jgi:hypothetical protein
MTDRKLLKIAKRLQKKGLPISADKLRLMSQTASEMDLLLQRQARFVRQVEAARAEAAVIPPPAILELQEAIDAVLASHAKPIDATLANLCHFLLHLLVPRCDRQIVERDLEEQFEEEASDLRLGPRQARILYCKRVTDNVLAYTWGRLSKRVRTVIVSSITGWVLKSFGLLPTLAALKDLGVLPWK